MTSKILLLLSFMTSVIFAQNDNIQKERYEVINAIFKSGKPTLDKNFLQYLGLGVLISEPEMIDSLLGHCIDMEKKETNSFAEIFSAEDISKMREQIASFTNIRTIDSTMITENINIVSDCENVKPAITLPLVYNDKAIVYLSNKINEESLLVYVKKDNEWIERCRKYIYLRFDD